MAKDFKNALKKYQDQEEATLDKEIEANFNEANKETTAQLEQLQENIQETISQLDEILYSDIDKLLKYYTNEKEQMAASYTLKTTKPLLDLLRGLACVEKLSIKELIVKALCDYIKNAPEKDLERAKEYKKKYLD